MTNQQPGSPAPTTEADVEVLGRVLLVDLHDGTIGLWTADETKITVSFTPEQEQEALTAFDWRNIACLQVQGQGKFVDGQLQHIAKIHQTKIVLDKREKPPDYRPIEEEIREIFKDVPAEEWAKLPKDLIENLDHYLYGYPKK